jgi:transposase
VKATSERVDAVKRAKALLGVAAGATLTAAGQEAGLSREAVAQLVMRFNQRGLAVLEIAAGRGRKPTYTSEQRARVLAEVQREPERAKDQTATWSLMTLRAALRQTDLPEIAAETIREILHEAGYRSQRSRTCVRTGYALRVRKSGTVTTSDPETPEKKLSGQRCRLSSSSPALFEGSEQGLTLVTKTKARELLALSAATLPS